MRVLINAASMRRGGAVTHMDAFLPQFVHKRASAKIGVLIPESSRTGLLGLGVNIHTHGIAAGSPLLRTYVDQGLVRWLGRRYDVVLSLLNHGPLFLDRPHILWARNQLLFEDADSSIGRIQARLALAAMNTATCVVFPSVSVRLSAERSGFNGQGRVIGHPVAPPRIDETIRSAREPWRILVPTSPQAHKNLGLLSRVSEALSQREVEHRLDVTAPGFSTTTTHGSVQSVDRYSCSSVFSSYDCILLTSLVESFSYPLLEAQILGVPVAASDIPVHREFGLLAELFDPTRADQAGDAIIAAVTGSSVERCGTRRQLREMHNPGSYAEQIWQLIDQVVDDS